MPGFGVMLSTVISFILLLYQERLLAQSLKMTSSIYLCLSNGSTMGCPPVRGDNPRALASGLSYVQTDKHGITILYHLHQCRPCTARDISCQSW